MKKLYYSISEVSKITDLEQYVLRYWETEFDQLKPAKNLAGNRIYTNKDIKLILHIKKLLRDEKYTIEGAKKLLKNYNIKEEELVLTGTDDVKSKTSFVHTKNELSLFNSSEEKISDSTENEIDNKPLISDLKELKSFLSELLKDIE
ncbi:MAG: MerR family transcriptional regulator [Ignavibacteria bacterium]